MLIFFKKIPVIPFGFTGIIISRIFLIPFIYLGWNFFIPILLFFFALLLHDLFLNYTIKQKFVLSFIYSIVFNIGVLSWMFFIDYGIIALIYNTIIYFIFYFVTFLITQKFKSIFTIIFLFIIFEFCSNLTVYLFPWCNLGNALSNYPLLIQWYSITGPIGGTIWLLLISNYLLFLKNKIIMVKLIILLVIPIIISTFIYRRNIENELIEKKIVTFNPEKFITEENLKQENKFNLNEKLCFYVYNNLKNLKGNYTLIMPEVTIRGIYFPQFNKSLSANYLRKIISEDKCSNICMGATCYTDYNVYNSAILIDSISSYIKVKKKLVPYVETLPNFLNKYMSRQIYSNSCIDSSLVINKIFKSNPIICYDAFYPFYFSRSCIDANYSIVISSEDFLKNNSIGINQYNNLLRLRCIENGKPLVKNSFKGNSMIINKHGLIENKSDKEWNIFTIKYNLNEKKTIFSKLIIYLNL